MAQWNEDELTTLGARQVAKARKTAIDMSRMYKERTEQISWEALVTGTKIVPSARQMDHEVLRDCLVDMCSATQSESPPSQKEWTEIRDKVKQAAVAHALLNREEKKLAPLPGLSFRCIIKTRDHQAIVGEAS